MPLVMPLLWSCLVLALPVAGLSVERQRTLLKSGVSTKEWRAHRRGFGFGGSDSGPGLLEALDSAPSAAKKAPPPQTEDPDDIENDVLPKRIVQARLRASLVAKSVVVHNKSNVSLKAAVAVNQTQQNVDSKVEAGSGDNEDVQQVLAEADAMADGKTDTEDDSEKSEENSGQNDVDDSQKDDDSDQKDDEKSHKDDDSDQKDDDGSQKDDDNSQEHDDSKEEDSSEEEDKDRGGTVENGDDAEAKVQASPKDTHAPTLQKASPKKPVALNAEKQEAKHVVANQMKAVTKAKVSLVAEQKAVSSPGMFQWLKSWTMGFR